MALPKEAKGQHKRMAEGEGNIGFKKGGSVETSKKGADYVNQEGKAEGFKRGGHVSHVHPSGRMKKNGGKC